MLQTTTTQKTPAMMLEGVSLMVLLKGFYFTFESYDVKDTDNTQDNCARSSITGLFGPQKG